MLNEKERGARASRLADAPALEAFIAASPPVPHAPASTPDYTPFRLPAGAAPGSDWVASLELDAARAFAPQLVVVSLGLDSGRGDPLGDDCYGVEVVREATEAIAAHDALKDTTR